MVLEECHTLRASVKFGYSMRPLLAKTGSIAKIETPFCASPEQILHGVGRIRYAGLASVRQHPKAERFQTVVIAQKSVSSNDNPVSSNYSASVDTVHPFGAQTS